jgi:hypothetical protein
MTDRLASGKAAGASQHRQSPSGAPITLRGILDALKSESPSLLEAAAAHLNKPPTVTVALLLDCLHQQVGSTAAFAALQLESSNLDLPLMLLKCAIFLMASESGPQLDASTVAVAVTVVARLTNFLADRPTTPRNVSQGGGGGAVRRTAEQDIRTFALIALAVLPAKHADLLLPHWPTLFPAVDATKCGNRHPVLTPLLFDASFRVRASAVAAVTQILQKSHTQLQFAAEARHSPAAPRAPNNSANSSNASYSSSSSGQSGSVLRQLHDCLFYALSARECSSSRGLSFAALAPVVISTPYSKCPGCLQVLGKCLMLPSLLELLSKRDTHDATSALVFLGAVLRSKSLVELVVKFLRSSSSEALVEAAVKTLPAVEGWKLCVHFARSAPWIIDRHFEFIFELAVRHIAAVSSDDLPEGPRQAAHGRDRAVEAVRCLLHFWGFAWESFDSTANDIQPAGPSNASDGPSPSAESLSSASSSGRATAAQKKRIFDSCFLPAASSTSSVELRSIAYKALGQVGEDFLTAPDFGQAGRAKIVELLVKQGSFESDAGAKAEVLGSLGVLAWKFPSMNSFHSNFVEVASKLLLDRDPLVRAKSGFVLSNIAGRTTSEMATQADVNEEALPPTSDILFAICEASVIAVQDCESSVVGHGVRMMCFALRALRELDLIMVVGGHEEGYSNYALTTFKSLVTQPRDAKLRWNAAYAIGEVLSRPAVVHSDPPTARDCVTALLAAVRTDPFFKVRSLTATALAKVSMAALRSSGYEMEASVFDGLCCALAACGETQSYAQYKEADQLKGDLLEVIRRMLESSPGTQEFQRILAAHRQQLIVHKLI